MPDDWKARDPSPHDASQAVDRMLGKQQLSSQYTKLSVKDCHSARILSVVEAPNVARPPDWRDWKGRSDVCKGSPSLEDGQRESHRVLKMQGAPQVLCQEIPVDTGPAKFYPIRKSTSTGLTGLALPAMTELQSIWDAGKSAEVRAKRIGLLVDEGTGGLAPLTPNRLTCLKNIWEDAPAPYRRRCVTPDRPPRDPSLSPSR
jgi:hypothetical protein